MLVDVGRRRRLHGRRRSGADYSRSSSRRRRGRRGLRLRPVVAGDVRASATATYFADYSNYNANLVGLVIDAGDLGLSDAEHPLSYTVVACGGVRGRRAGRQICDTTGEIDPDTGTYPAFLDVTAPALTFSPATVGGFFGGGTSPVTVAVGSAEAGDDPSILAVFPNNAPGDQFEIVTTTT